MSPAWLDALQWPAMLCSVLASWWVASPARRRRRSGFAVFLLSNVLWVAWAVPASAYALIVLQLALSITNVRGILENPARASAPAGSRSSTDAR